MSLKSFTQSLARDGVEGELVKTTFVSLCTSFITLGILYFLVLQYVENFISRYGFFIFFSLFSYALILPSTKHVKGYKEFPCMSGMMIGMTIGMIAGFLPGFYVAATNGMFYGGTFGMILGILFGVWNGRCCGVMGVMEGIMAGFMGGLMGAMTAFMLLNDHLTYASIIVFFISAIIIYGLNYMIFKESSQLEKEIRNGNFMIILLSFILTVITVLLMVYRGHL